MYFVSECIFNVEHNRICFLWLQWEQKMTDLKYICNQALFKYTATKQTKFLPTKKEIIPEFLCPWILEQVCSNYYQNYKVTLI